MSAFQKSEAAIERQAEIERVRDEQAASGVQVREQMEDMAILSEIFQAVGGTMINDEHGERRNVAAGLRLGRPVCKRAAVVEFQKRAAETIERLFAARLNEREREVLAAALAGVPLTSFVGKLDGSIPTTATEYAAATVDLTRGRVVKFKGGR